MDKEPYSKEILKEYKSYILFEQKTMTEAEYWRGKYYGDIYKN